MVGFFSLAAALAGFAGSVWLDVQIEGGKDELSNMPVSVQILYETGIPIFLIAAGVFVLGGIRVWSSVGKTIENLKKESRWGPADI